MKVPWSELVSVAFLSRSVAGEKSLGPASGHGQTTRSHAQQAARVRNGSEINVQYVSSGTSGHSFTVCSTISATLLIAARVSRNFLEGSCPAPSPCCCLSRVDVYGRAQKSTPQKRAAWSAASPKALKCRCCCGVGGEKVGCCGVASCQAKWGWLLWASFFCVRGFVYADRRSNYNTFWQR